MTARQVLAYARVSTDDQTLSQQRAAIVDAYPPGTDIDWYEDQQSGWQGCRADYELLKKVLQRKTGVEVCVFSISRLGRNQQEALRFMNIVQERGHKLRVLKENLDFSGPMGYALFTLFCALAQMESDTKSQAIKAKLRQKQEQEDWRCHGSPAFCLSQKVKDKAQTVYDMHDAGHSNKHISRQLSLTERTVARVLSLRGYPLLTRKEFAALFPGWHKLPATKQPTLDDIKARYEEVNAK